VTARETRFRASDARPRSPSSIIRSTVGIPPVWDQVREVRVGIQLDPLDGLALIGATIVGFMVLLRLGALGPWRNALGGFFPIVLPLIVGLGLVLGLSMHLDTSGLPASGEIVLKEEQVRFAHNGSWTRSQRLLVKYAPLSPAGYFIRETSGRETSDPLLNRMRIEGEGRQIDVDVDTYDRLRVGDRIGVRYLAQKPGLFRLEGQSTESWLWSIAGMIPLATGEQEGGEILQPLAVAVIGGIPAVLLATLIVLPILYVLCHERSTSRAPALATKDASAVTT